MVLNSVLYISLLNRECSFLNGAQSTTLPIVTKFPGKLVLILCSVCLYIALYFTSDPLMVICYVVITWMNCKEIGWLNCQGKFRVSVEMKNAAVQNKIHCWILMRFDTLKIQIQYIVNSAHRILLMIISLYYYTKSEVQHSFKDRNIFELLCLIILWFVLFCFIYVFS